MSIPFAGHRKLSRHDTHSFISNLSCCNNDDRLTSHGHIVQTTTMFTGTYQAISVFCKEKKFFWRRKIIPDTRRSIARVNMYCFIHTRNLYHRHHYNEPYKKSFSSDKSAKISPTTTATTKNTIESSAFHVEDNRNCCCCCYC